MDQPADHANQAAEQLRGLAHATHQRHVDDHTIADAYRFTGALTDVAASLAQCCEQLVGIVEHRQATSHLRHDTGGSPDAAVAAGIDAYREAAAMTRVVLASLTEAQNSIAGIGETADSVKTRDRARQIERREQ